MRYQCDIVNIDALAIAEFSQCVTYTGGKMPAAAACSSTLLRASLLVMPVRLARATSRSCQGLSMYQELATRPASLGLRPGFSLDCSVCCFAAAVTASSMLSTSRRSDSMQNPLITREFTR